jgi:hypothetical protein
VYQSIIYSDSEHKNHGAGQLLISAIVACAKHNCNVMAMLLHPQMVRITILYNVNHIVILTLYKSPKMYFGVRFVPFMPKILRGDDCAANRRTAAVCTY